MSGYNRKPRKSRGTTKPATTGSGRGSSGSVFPRVGNSDRTGRVVSPTLPSSPSGPLGKGFGGSVDPLNGATYDGSTTGANWGKDFLYPILNAIQGSQSGSILDFLTANGITLSKEQQDAMYQFLLQYMAQIDQRTYDQQLTQDKRSYEWSLLQDARLYDNPTNQLARLMGSGISRDAAIQMMSGSGASGSSGLGAGAGTPISNQPTSAGSVPAVSGSQDLNIANTVMSGVQMLVNILGQGIDMSTAISQAKTARAQASLSQAELSAFQGINDITQAFNNAVFDGTLTVDDLQGLRTADDYYKYIVDHSDTNLVRPLISSGAVKRAFGSTYGRSMMNQHLSQTRSARDSGVLADEYIKQQRMQSTIMSLQPEQISAEIAVLGTQKTLNEQSVVESMTRVAEGNARIQVLNEQGEWIDMQTKKTAADIDLVRAEITGQQIENGLAGQNYRYNEAGFPMLIQNRIDALTETAQRFYVQLHDPDTKDAVYEQRVRSWLLEPENAADAAYVIQAQTQAVGDFARDYPGIYKLGMMFKDLGFDKLLKVTGEVATSVATGVNALGL